MFSHSALQRAKQYIQPSSQPVSQPVSQPASQSGVEPTPIFSQKLVDRCHIVLPDSPQPTSAIYYEGQYYAFVKFFPTMEIAQQKAALMTQRGNAVLLTRVAKGLVLWVHEPDAQPAKRK